MFKKFEDFDKKEQKAILKLYTEINHDFGEEQEVVDRINNDLRYDYLTNHTVRNKKYLWYLDENVSLAIDIETLQIIEDNEIEKIGLC